MLLKKKKSEILKEFLVESAFLQIGLEEKKKHISLGMDE